MAQTYIDIAALDTATDLTIISDDEDEMVTKETVDGMDVLTAEKPTSDEPWYIVFNEVSDAETTNWEVWCAVQVVQYIGSHETLGAAGVAGNIIDLDNNYVALTREERRLALLDRGSDEGTNFSEIGDRDVLQIGRIVGVRMRLESDFTQRGKHWWESISGGESSTLDTLVSNESAGWDGSRTPAVQFGAGQIGITVRRSGTYRFYAIGIGTDGDPAPTEPVGVGAEDHTAAASQVFPAPLQSASASHTEPESHTATASQVFPAPLQSATATHAEPENHSASASQVFPAPLQSATATHSSVEGNSASATQVFPAPLQSATATHAAPENHSAAATQVFPAPLQSAVATHTAAASHTASATQIFPAPLQSAVATHVAPESHSATATQVFPAPIQAAVVVHSDRELKAPVRARISSAQRFTSNTSTSERIQ